LSRQENEVLFLDELMELRRMERLNRTEATKQAIIKARACRAVPCRAVPCRAVPAAGRSGAGLTPTADDQQCACPRRCTMSSTVGTSTYYGSARRHYSWPG
jgi:hypothetical protein